MVKILAFGAVAAALLGAQPSAQLPFRTGPGGSPSPWAHVRLVDAPASGAPMLAVPPGVPMQPLLITVVPLCTRFPGNAVMVLHGDKASIRFGADADLALNGAATALGVRSSRPNQGSQPGSTVSPAPQEKR